MLIRQYECSAASQTVSGNFIISSESVGEGHPDKVCDKISDEILDACLTEDPHSRVACETFVKSNLAIVGGEITSKSRVDFARVIRRTVRDIGYVNADDVFHADSIFITQALTEQSPDIAQGVDGKETNLQATESQGAGDQGLMFGYACDETPELMPAPICFAHQLMRRLTRMRKSGIVSWLRPDAKSQVSVRYRDGVPDAITSVVLSTQHTAQVSQQDIRDFIEGELIRRTLDNRLLSPDTRIHINPTGQFVIGGPQGDAGVTGRKIIVDTYGGLGRHGGGAFSGKDASKVDRSAAYMARYVAKNIVAAGLANRCEVQLAYAIGYSRPVSVAVNSFGTGKHDDGQLREAVEKVFRLDPDGIIRQLDLCRPIFSKTTNYGHFGRTEDLDVFTWEQTDRTEQLQEAIKFISTPIVASSLTA